MPIQYPTGNQTRCAPCGVKYDPKCSDCNENECLKCKEGYYYEFLSKTCIACSEGCLDCDQDGCNRCDDGYIRRLKKDYIDYYICKQLTTV